MRDLEFELANVLRVTVHSANLNPDAGAGGLLAEADDITIELLGLFAGEDISAGVDRVSLYDTDGDAGTVEAFAIDGVTVTLPPINLTAGDEPMAAATDLELDFIDVTNRFGIPAGTIAVSATEFDVLPEAGQDEFSATATGVTGSLDVSSGAMSVTAGSFDARIGESLHVEGSGAALTIDPRDEAGSALLASLNTGTIAFPNFADLPTIDLTGLTLTENSLTLDAFSAAFPSERSVVGQVAELEELTIGGQDIRIDFDGPAASFGGTLSIDAAEASLLPDFDTTELDGIVTLSGFAGNINVRSGALSLEATEASLVLGEVLTATVNEQQTVPVGIVLDFDPLDDDPAATFATLHELRLGLPGLPDLPSDELKVGTLHLRRNGLDLDASFGGFGEGIDLNIPALLDAGDTTVDVGLSADFASPDGQANPATMIAGSVAVTTGIATLLPGSLAEMTVGDDEVNDETPALKANVELNTGRFTFDLRQLDGSLGPAIAVDADPDEVTGEPALSFTFDPNAAPTDSLLTTPSLKASLPWLAVQSVAPEVSVEDFAVRYDGGIGMSRFDVDLPAGWTSELGLSGLVPIEIRHITGTVEQTDGVVDLTTARFTVSSVALDENGDPIDDPATRRQEIEQDTATRLKQGATEGGQQNPSPGLTVSIERANAANDGWVPLGSEGLAFDLLLVDGVPRLVNTPALRFTLNDWTVPLGDGEVTFGSLTDNHLTLGGLDADGVPSFIPASLGDSYDGTQKIVAQLSATAGSSAGTVSGTLTVGGDWSITSEAFVFDLTGSATLSGDLSFAGFGASASDVTVNFDWSLRGVEDPTSGTWVVSGAPRLRDVNAQDIEFVIDNLLKLTIDEAEIDLGGAALVTAQGARLEFLVPELSGISGTVANVTFYDDEGGDGVADGFSLTGLTLTHTGGFELGPQVSDDDPAAGGTVALVEVDGVITFTFTQFTYRNATITETSPFTLALDGAASLNGPFDAALTDPQLMLTPDPANPAFAVNLASIDLGIGPRDDNDAPLLGATATNVELILDQDPSTDLIALDEAALRFGEAAGVLAGIAFTLAPRLPGERAFRFNLVDDDADPATVPAVDVLLGDVTLDAGQGLLGRLGLGGLLPMDLTELSVEFPDRMGGYTDFSTIDVLASGTFSFPQGVLDVFTPTISIGAGAAAGEFREVGLRIEQRDTGVGFAVRPLVEDVRLGFADLKFGNLAFEGHLAYAGFNAFGEALVYEADGSTSVADPAKLTKPNWTGRLGVSNNGMLSPADAAFDFDDLTVDLAGRVGEAIREGLSGQALILEANLNADFTLRFGDLMELDDFGATVNLDWFASDAWLAMESGATDPTLDFTVAQVRTGGIAVDFGDWLEVSLNGTPAGPDGLIDPPDDADNGMLALNLVGEDEQGNPLPLVEAASISMSIPILGIGGELNDFEIDQAGRLGLGADPSFAFTIGEGEDAGLLGTLQQYLLPIQVSRVDLQFGESFFERDPATDRVTGFHFDQLFDALVVTVDGSFGTPGFLDLGDEFNLTFRSGLDNVLLHADAFNAFLDDLAAQLGLADGWDFEDFFNAFDLDLIEVNFGELEGLLNFEQTDGFSIEAELALGDAFAFGGTLALGNFDLNEDHQYADDRDIVDYFIVDGQAKIASYGLGGKLVMTSAGPIAANIDIGVPIPVGPTTLTLGGAGTILFGVDPLAELDESQPVINPANLPDTTQMTFDTGAIEHLLRDRFWVDPTPGDDGDEQLLETWTGGVTLALDGTVSSLAVAGAVSLNGTVMASLTLPTPADQQGGGNDPADNDLGPQTGLSFQAYGDLSLLGMPLGKAAVLLDARDLIAPTISFGFSAPPPGNPLGFLFPAKAELAGTLRTDGMIESWIIGLRALIDGAFDNVSSFDPLLNEMASNIDADNAVADTPEQFNPLYRALNLPTQTPLDLDVESLKSALLGALAIPDPGDPQAMAATGEMLAELISEIQRAAAEASGFDVTGAIQDGFAQLFAGGGDSLQGALQAAWEAFNPSLTIRGAIQPTIFGLAFGEPTDEVAISINKREISFGLSTSLKDTLRKTLGLAPALAPLAELLVAPGFSDRLSFQFEADLPTDVLDQLLLLDFDEIEFNELDFGNLDPATAFGGLMESLLDALNPFTGWSASVTGELLFLNFEIGQVNGLIFGPQGIDDGNGGLLRDNDGKPLLAEPDSLFARSVHPFYWDREDPDLETLFDNATVPPPNPDGLPEAFSGLIPVYLDDQYDALVEYGGLMLTGELMIPDILRDPGPVIESVIDWTNVKAGELTGPDGAWTQLTDPQINLDDLSNLGDVVTELQEYLDGLMQRVTPVSPLATMQVFLPSPSFLFDAVNPLDFDNIDGTTERQFDRVDEDGEDSDATIFTPAVQYDAENQSHHGTLLFADLNANGFYDPWVDLLVTPGGDVTDPLSGAEAWADDITVDDWRGDLSQQAGEDTVDPAVLNAAMLYVLGDVAEDLGSGRLEAAAATDPGAGQRVGFVDLNRDGKLEWRYDRAGGELVFLEPLMPGAWDGAYLTDVDGRLIDPSTAPGLSVFIDATASVVGNEPDGYTPAGSGGNGDRFVGLNEGFFDVDGDGRFDLGVDELYDLNGNGLPDGELFVDTNNDGRLTEPEPFTDVNGNGEKDADEGEFVDLNDNDVWDAGDPILDLGDQDYQGEGQALLETAEGSLLDRVAELLGVAYAEGFMDVELLGLDLGFGRISLNSEGFTASLDVPPLGLEADASVRFSSLNMGELMAELADNALIAGAFAALAPDNSGNDPEDLAALLRQLGGDFEFLFPVAGLEAGMDVGAARDWLADALGITPQQLNEHLNLGAAPGDDLDGTLGLGIFSPGFDPDDPVHPTADPESPVYLEPPLDPLKEIDDVKRYGGVRVTATLDVPGFVTGGLAVLETQFPNSADDLLFGGDFAMLARAETLALPNLSDDLIRAEDLRLTLVRQTDGQGENYVLIDAGGTVRLFEGLGGGVTAEIGGGIDLDFDEGMVGYFNLELGAGSAGEPIDLGNGAIIGGGATFRLLVNTTDQAGGVDFDGDGVDDVQVEGNSAEIYIDGSLELDAVAVNGTFRLSLDEQQIVIQADGSVQALEDFAGGFNLDVAGALVFTYQAADPDDRGVAGFLDVDASVNELTLGNGLTLGGNLALRTLFNTAESDTAIDLLDGTIVPIRGESFRLWADGDLAFGESTLSGAITFQAEPDKLLAIGQDLTFTDDRLLELFADVDGETPTGVSVSVAATIETLADGHRKGAFVLDVVGSLEPFFTADALFGLAFNTSGLDDQTVSFETGSINTPADFPTYTPPTELAGFLTLERRSVRLFASGSLNLGDRFPQDTVSIDGTVMAEVGWSAMDPKLEVYAEGTIEAGVAGTASGFGYLRLRSDGVAGLLSLTANQLDLPELTITGTAELWFNSGIVASVPSYASPEAMRSLTRRDDAGHLEPYFELQVSGVDNSPDAVVHVLDEKFVIRGGLTLLLSPTQVSFDGQGSLALNLPDSDAPEFDGFEAGLIVWLDELDESSDGAFEVGSTSLKFDVTRVENEWQLQHFDFSYNFPIYGQIDASYDSAGCLEVGPVNIPLSGECNVPPLSNVILPASTTVFTEGRDDDTLSVQIPVDAWNIDLLPSTQNVSVNVSYRIVGDPADDFDSTLRSETIIVDADTRGWLDVPIPIYVTDDNDSEGDETFTFELIGPLTAEWNDVSRIASLPTEATAPIRVLDNERPGDSLIYFNFNGGSSSLNREVTFTSDGVESDDVSSWVTSGRRLDRRAGQSVGTGHYAMQEDRWRSGAGLSFTFNVDSGTTATIGGVEFWHRAIENDAGRVEWRLLIEEPESGDPLVKNDTDWLAVAEVSDEIVSDGDVDQPRKWRRTRAEFDDLEPLSSGLYRVKLELTGYQATLGEFDWRVDNFALRGSTAIVSQPPPIDTDPPDYAPELQTQRSQSKQTYYPALIYNGRIDGGSFFLDANGNLSWDFLDLNGDGFQDAGEPDEPASVTNAAGEAFVPIDIAFDRDNSGIIEPDEGLWIVAGGEDISTGVTRLTAMRGVVGELAVSPLTTLATRLLLDSGMDIDAASDAINRGLGVDPTFHLFRTDGVRGLRNGVAGVETHYLALTQTAQAVELATAANTTADSGLDAVAVGQSAYDWLADRAADADSAGTVLDLSDTKLMQALLNHLAGQWGATLDPSVRDAVAAAIAGVNLQVAEIALPAGEAYLEAAKQVQAAAFGPVRNAMVNTVQSGDEAPLLALLDPQALDAAVAGATVLDLETPRITVADSSLPEGASGFTAFPFVVSLSEPSDRLISLQYRTISDGATGGFSAEDADYRTEQGMIIFEPGQTEALIEVTVYGDTVDEFDERFELVLSNADGALLEDNRAFGTIVSDDAPPHVAGQFLVYNNSVFDGYDPTADAADDLAIASNKSAVFPLIGSDDRSYITYSLGINAVIVDIAASNGTPSLSDFTFKFGAGDDPSLWAGAPAPQSFAVQPDMGVGGSDRVTVTWPENAIENTWLEVTVLADDAGGGLGLTEGSAFYFGHLRGDGNGDGIVDASDVIIPVSQMRDGLSPAEITNSYDHNRDGLVNTRDMLIARSNLGTVLPPLTTSSPETVATVRTRQVFYDGSSWDDSLKGRGDDDAIDPTKSALLPGGTASAANFSTYSRGLNGVVVDVDDLAEPDQLSAADFQLAIGDNSDPATWDQYTGDVQIAVRPGEGENGADRLSLTIPELAVSNSWLQVRILATSNTGLAADDVFYFGNLIGDSSGDGLVTTDDLNVLAANLQDGLGPAAVSNPYDHDRNGLTNVRDMLIARSHLGAFLPMLTVPMAGTASTADVHGAPVLDSSAPLESNSRTSSEQIDLLSGEKEADYRLAAWLRSRSPAYRQITGNHDLREWKPLIHDALDEDDDTADLVARLVR